MERYKASVLEHKTKTYAMLQPVHCYLVFDNNEEWEVMHKFSNSVMQRILKLLVYIRFSAISALAA